MNTSKGAHHVLKRTSDYLKSGLVEKQPAWYKVLAYHPPREEFQKKVRLDTLKRLKFSEPALKDGKGEENNGFFKTRLRPSEFKDRLFKPTKLEFIEDEIRNLFYKQHPWELADPKSLIENENSIDSDRFNWETLKQIGKKLDGESVVQRTIYLMNKQDKPLIESYEQAKFEYYRLKIEEETETNVTKEEQDMYGAIYGKSAIDYGFEKEMEVLAKWKKDAVELTKISQAKFASNVGTTTTEDEAAETDRGFNEDDMFREMEAENTKKSEQ